MIGSVYIKDVESAIDGLLKQHTATPTAPIESDKKVRELVKDALEKAHEYNESNGYHNAFDIELILDAVFPLIQSTQVDKKG